MFKTILLKVQSVLYKMGNWFKNIWQKLFVLIKKIGDYLVIFSKTKAFSIGLKVFVVLVGILAIAELYLGIAVYGFKSQDKVANTVAKVLPLPLAVVNYDVITYQDFLKERNYIHHFYNATEQGDINFRDVDSQIMDQLIENKIVAYEAIRYHATVKKSDVDSAINNIIEQNGGQDKVEKVLADLYGLKMSDFRKLVKVQLTRDKVNQNVIQHVTARHILIRVDQNATTDQVNAAKTKIDGILAEINKGADFAAEATKFSEDTGSASNGGLLDSFARGEMVTEFSDTAFTTPVGSISAPVRTEFGWHIIKVESKTGTVDRSFADWLSGIKKKSLILNFYQI